TRDNYHDWVLANENMARVLADKGYHYQFVFARNGGHTDRTVKQQTLPEALEYIWQGDKRPRFLLHFSILRRILAIEIDPIERGMAQRLAALRAERGWALEELADRTGISRATLSRLERCELSPTATMLNTLCSQYGWTASRLMAEAESGPPTVVRAAEQVSRTDPDSGYVRRMVSPPHAKLKGELVEASL